MNSGMIPNGCGVNWKFCEVCQNVVHLTQGGGWEQCSHDWRPNSPAGVLENQKKELRSYKKEIFDLFQGPRTYQSPHELIGMLRVLDIWGFSRGITIVEIGTYHGGTAHILKSYLGPEKLICVDVNFGHWMAGDIAEAIQGISAHKETLSQVENALGGKGIDLLFIDGDHSLQGARDDWNCYAPWVNIGGVIVFHDTMAIKEVGQVFNEVKGQFKVEFKSFQGIGMVVK